MTTSSRANLLIVLVGLTVSAQAGAETVSDRYDDTFRKYTKRFFGPGYDWRIFKAQAMTESNISMDAKSWVGARGIMQLMPATFKEIRSKNPEIVAIDQPEWNIAAGIYYDRQLWGQWERGSGSQDRNHFMFASYNAGRGTLLRAQKAARTSMLDPSIWPSIQSVAPNVPKWRHEETLNYVAKIDKHAASMDEEGRVGR
ncbi:transglycosylase SLT domain-containing protein [Sphingomonas sp. SM33]|uniref:Transglycosylase SLT domain-containing protein n=1 Tax=Sphingomonas telluris TaxID=2907998 RepID=A0ABS9VPQ2_9SPHN|nr:transglycosylase SLT domain-containing protein [Sphingomonas telluris]MCH8616683.1 transglycosylase SLT domain-containing protein [Sphingomonas telluris]